MFILKEVKNTNKLFMSANQISISLVFRKMYCLITSVCNARYKTRPGLSYHYNHFHNGMMEPEEPEPSPKSVGEYIMTKRTSGWNVQYHFDKTAFLAVLHIFYL